MKPVCVPCQRFFRPAKNGFSFIEGMPRAGEHMPEPGTAAPEKWEPYKLWRGDLWRCEGCDTTIIVGVALEPLSEHYKDHFADVCHDFGANLQINDC